MVDKDADGRISEEEVEEIISLSASANKLSNIQKQAKEYAALIMEELDPENAGYIMIYNLETLLLQAPNQSVRVTDSRVLSQMLSQKLKPTLEDNPLRIWYQKSKYFLMDNWQRVWVMLLWLGIVLGLFAYKFVQYRNKAVFRVMGYCVCVAKGGAETLKFNMALILLPVCRNTITWLRNKTKLGKIVPFDDNLNFHKVIAAGIAPCQLNGKSWIFGRSINSAVTATGGSDGNDGREQREAQSQRKQKRNWSPELHRRFLNALQQLGGSHGV